MRTLAERRADRAEARRWQDYVAGKLRPVRKSKPYRWGLFLERTADERPPEASTSGWLIQRWRTRDRRPIDADKRTRGQGPSWCMPGPRRSIPGSPYTRSTALQACYDRLWKAACIRAERKLRGVVLP